MHIDKRCVMQCGAIRLLFGRPRRARLNRACNDEPVFKSPLDHAEALGLEIVPEAPVQAGAFCEGDGFWCTGKDQYQAQIRILPGAPRQQPGNAGIPKELGFEIDQLLCRGYPARVGFLNLGHYGFWGKGPKAGFAM